MGSLPDGYGGADCVLRRSIPMDWRLAVDVVALAQSPTLEELLLGPTRCSAEDTEAINKDVHRSGRRELGVADQEAEAHRTAVRQILHGWCAFKPAIGYVQGLNIIAAAVLLHCNNVEHSAFSVLVLLVSRLPSDFYGERLRGCVAEVGALVRLFRASSRLTHHMNAHACTCVHMRELACTCVHVRAHACTCNQQSAYLTEAGVDIPPLRVTPIADCICADCMPH